MTTEAFYRLSLYIPSEDYDAFMVTAKKRKWPIRMEYPFERHGNEFVQTHAIMGGFVGESINDPAGTRPGSEGNAKDSAK